MLPASRGPTISAAHALPLLDQPAALPAPRIRRKDMSPKSATAGILTYRFDPENGLKGNPNSSHPFTGSRCYQQAHKSDANAARYSTGVDKRRVNGPALNARVPAKP